mmetsp:Transcript_38478/g.108754  ORF Transcript_38478/g.108754 Transcript_38478/m.108754 type:complete len:261 (-) Transcript_38478:1331-2113(-)
MANFPVLRGVRTRPSTARGYTTTLGCRETVGAAYGALLSPCSPDRAPIRLVCRAKRVDFDPTLTPSSFLASLRSKPQAASKQKSSRAEGKHVRDDTEEEQYVGLTIERALGVDYGRKFTGVAVSAGGIAPRELPLLRTGDPSTDIYSQILALAMRESVNSIIVGLPVTHSGDIWNRETDSQQGRRCRNLAESIATILKSRGRSDIAVMLYDERRTSMEASEAMSEARGGKQVKRLVDGVAACIILSRYFEYPEEAVQVYV